MNPRKKTKARKATAVKSRAKVTPEKINQALDAALYVSSAKARREQEAERQRQKRQFYEAQRPKPIKRELSQIKFSQWWKDRDFIQRLTENQIPIEEEKAAMWYEAARRRPEVQKAWLEGKFLFGDNGWQHFTGWVVMNLPLSWVELEPITKHGIIKASYGPWSVPPEGLSTFPETHKAEQKKASMQLLRLPKSNDPDAAQRFVEHARRFAEAGFLIVAVDKKQNQAVRAACAALEKLPPTFRTVDLAQEKNWYLPPEVSQEDMQALEEIRQKRPINEDDITPIWRKWEAKTGKHVGHTLVESVAVPMHKRKRGEKLIEEKQFNFESICRQLEAFDNGCVSEFVNSVRL